MFRLAALLLAAVAQEATNLPSLPAAEFQSRRQALMDRLPKGPIVMEAEKLIPGMDGIAANTPRFDFTYVTGYHSAGDLVVLFPADRKVFLFTKGDPAEVRRQTGLEHVLSRDAFPAFCKEVLAAAETIFTRVRREALTEIEKAAPDSDIRSSDDEGRNVIHQHLTRQRMIKSPAEILMMKKAADATNAAHLAALRACKGGLNEGELQKLIEDTFKAQGCDGLGFPSIVGSGKNGTILHYTNNKDPMPADSLVVVDIGASYRGYVTDITRTLPTDGRFTDEQREAYQCVLDAQKAAERLLKPGATFAELDAASRKVFEERKLTKWSYAHARDWSVRHGLGHYVGMAVHDSGSSRAKLEAGMVITIEPGYYDKDRGWGIRIEDIYLVTKDGFERWSSAPPREAQEIEKLMAEARAKK